MLVAICEITLWETLQLVKFEDTLSAHELLSRVK